ncbi:MAG: hypothetical protein K9W44_13175 [Candidatus Lokiarchaeota archaeon]|nr:hypothetical protein [Candidatus Harpocratesius repetitus]
MSAIWIATSEFIIAGGLILFWIYFFTVENRNPKNSPEYLAFERSFPIPDLVWLTPALIISGITVIQNSKLGIILTIAVGGSLLFLGLLDTSFNFQNEGYTKSIVDTIMNLSINVICIGMGIVFLIVGGSWITF